MTLQPCPFCGSGNVKLQEHTYSYVVCPDCHAMGPVQKRTTQAIKLWNEQKYGAKKRLEELFPKEP